MRAAGRAKAHRGCGGSSRPILEQLEGGREKNTGTAAPATSPGPVARASSLAVRPRGPRSAFSYDPAAGNTGRCSKTPGVLGKRVVCLFGPGAGPACQRKDRFPPSRRAPDVWRELVVLASSRMIRRAAAARHAKRDAVRRVLARRRMEDYRCGFHWQQLGAAVLTSRWRPPRRAGKRFGVGAGGEADG